MQQGWQDKRKEKNTDKKKTHTTQLQIIELLTYAGVSVLKVSGCSVIIIQGLTSDLLFQLQTAGWRWGTERSGVEWSVLCVDVDSLFTRKALSPHEKERVRLTLPDVMQYGI